MHARRNFCPVLFTVYREAYCSDELSCKKDGLLGFDEEGPSLFPRKRNVSVLCLSRVLMRMVGGNTSGSGDCGKLVVKRESNSGIAGGCYDGCE